MAVRGGIMWKRIILFALAATSMTPAIATPNNIFGGVNSIINDKERIFILPINYRLTNPSKWLELRPPRIIRPSNKPEIPINLSKPVGIALVGEPGNKVLRISLYFEGETKSSCYQPEIREYTSPNTLDLTLVNKWNPMLFCDNNRPKPFTQVFYSRQVHLPGSYRISVNGQIIAHVSYSLESGQAEIKYNDQTYTLNGVNQILLFTKPEETENNSPNPN
jgi:hypothetical protein